MGSFSNIPVMRFVHWGPMTAMAVMGCVTLCTMHMHDMWWPGTTIGSYANKHIFMLLSMFTFYNFSTASLGGPGFLAIGWKPENSDDEAKLQRCWQCDGFKAPRSHHCRKCGRCVKKMDHHCPWINTCVGWANHAAFTRFLAFAVAGCAHATVILSCALVHCSYRDWRIYHQSLPVEFTLFMFTACLFSIGLSVGVVISVGMLLAMQCRSIVRNRTCIEDWILDKACYRRRMQAELRRRREAGDYAEADADEDDEYEERPLAEYRHPYDLGSWRRNAAIVFGRFGGTQTLCGNGIEWQLADGCDAFALPLEQIAQKAEKRARARTYRVWRPVSGSWLPLWSQGLAVAVHPPCTDETRVRLLEGDVVVVTRWKKHWLFGERVRAGDRELAKRERVRGWFPRRCVAEVFGDNVDDERPARKSAAERKMD